MLARRGPAVYVLRYRVRGWNAPARDALLDARWATAALAERHPGVPVVLLGHSMGGRAALGAAGAPNVAAVCALAPWLDGSDPVAQLAGRTVLIAHGDRERYTDPAASYAYAAARQGGRGRDLPVRPARRRPLHAHAASATGTGWCGGSCSAWPGSNPSTR